MAESQSIDIIMKEIEQTFGRVPEWVQALPESALPGFWSQMRDFYLAETSIPNKYKDLIGIAVAGATRCRYCALFHTEGARLWGASEEEIAEASALAAFSMEGSTFLNAMQIDYERFAEEVRDSADYVRQQQAEKTQGAPGKKAA